MIILRCLTGLIYDWLKSYDTKHKYFHFFFFAILYKNRHLHLLRFLHFFWFLSQLLYQIRFRLVKHLKMTICISVLHSGGFTTYWLSIRTKLVPFIEIALHCIAMTAIFTQNDHFFKPDQIDWKRLICSAFNQNDQVWKKWSFWMKIVVIAMQCIFYEGDKLGADRLLPITVLGLEFFFINMMDFFLTQGGTLQM